MEDVLAALISGLVFAAVTGVTLVAYRHPEGYLRLALVLVFPLSLAVAGGFVWNFAIARAGAAIPFSTTDVFAAREAVRELFLPSSVLVALGGALVYVLVLPGLMGALRAGEPAPRDRPEADDRDRDRS
jgi:hypothetical protein